MDKAKDGRGLFMQSNGLPMVFHLPPGSTKKKLAPIIKQHGGEITSRNLTAVIRLADEKLWTSRLLSGSSDCYWPTYVLDCVKQDLLLDVELYKCSKGKHLMRKIIVEEGKESSVDEYDFAFGDDMAVTRNSWNKKGRMQYTKREDMNILKYLMENGEYSRAKGKAVWNTMEKLQITGHSAQSMMTRFRKVILEHLDNYNIPDSWKSCLTGDIVRYAQTTKASATKGGSEDSGLTNEVMDALTTQVTTDRLSPQPSTSRGHQESSISPEEEGQISEDAIIEDIDTDMDTDTQDSFDQQLLQMARSDVHEVRGDRTGATVGASEPVVGAHEPSGSAAEPRVNGSDSECSSAKRRRRGRGEEESEEGEGEEAVPVLSAAEKRLRKLVQHRLRRSPRRSSRKAGTSSVGMRGVEEGGRAQGRGSPRGHQSPTQSRSTGHTTPSTSSTMLCPVTPPIGRDAVLYASSFSEIGVSPSSSREREKLGKRPAKRMKALGVIRALSEEFELTFKEAQALLWRNSGQVDATRYWITMGRTLPGHHYWSPEEDEVLLTCGPDHPHWQTLQGLYGLSPVQHRMGWLQDHHR